MNYNLQGNRTYFDYEEIRQLYLKGLKWQEIMDKVGCSRTVIENATKGIERPNKLIDLDKIRELHNKGISKKEILSIMNCSKSTYYKALKGD